MNAHTDIPIDSKKTHTNIKYLDEHVTAGYPDSTHLFSERRVCLYVILGPLRILDLIKDPLPGDKIFMYTLQT